MKRSNSHFTAGSGMYECRCCLRRTRHTGGDGAGVQLCDLCYELAGEENAVSDTGELYGTPEGVLKMIADVATKGGSVACWDELVRVAQLQIIAKQKQVTTGA